MMTKDLLFKHLFGEAYTGHPMVGASLDADDKAYFDKLYK